MANFPPAVSGTSGSNYYPRNTSWIPPLERPPGDGSASGLSSSHQSLKGDIQVFP